MKRYTLAIILTVICFSCFGQYQDYRYKRKLDGISGNWHKIILPNDIFNNVSNDLSDVRIIGVRRGRDTIEVPYVINEQHDEYIRKEIEFELINQTHNKRGYYYTFEFNTPKMVNHVFLDFNERNFDWRINLEASNNQSEWFTVLENYRILSISNMLTDYKFTKLQFPKVKYRYLRLFIRRKSKPNLLSANIYEQDLNRGVYRKYDINDFNVSTDKKRKKTYVSVKLNNRLPITSLSVFVNEKFDYYRSVEVDYLVDSTETPKGWVKNFRSIYRGTLSSLEENSFYINPVKASELRFKINNDDNKALQIDSVTVRGNVYELMARFDDEADYYLLYGNSSVIRPIYDIEKFRYKIPDTAPELIIGDETQIERVAPEVKKPIFENKIWLWAIMIIVILVLGYFSIKMIKGDGS